MVVGDEFIDTQFYILLSTRSLCCERVPESSDVHSINGPETCVLDGR